MSLRHRCLDSRFDGYAEFITAGDIGHRSFIYSLISWRNPRSQIPTGLELTRSLTKLWKPIWVMISKWLIVYLRLG